MKLISVILFNISFCFSLTAQETWTIDNPHSNVRFEVGWEDFSMRTGEFKVFEGTIVTNSREDLSDATISFTVDATSVDVIADRLAGHIKSDKFLDVEKYPKITYTSNQLKKNSDDTYTSTGQLSIHGVEKEQEVNVTFKGSKETKKGFLLGLQVTLMVNKSDYGLDWGRPRLADNIKLVGHLLYKLKVEEEE
ncbi:MAG: polyisoprenoid-binding protein YceI [Saprospiraceae bacterium]|jgi:polyisoprenoid-binding protein YceI